MRNFIAFIQKTLDEVGDELFHANGDIAFSEYRLEHWFVFITIIISLILIVFSTLAYFLTTIFENADYSKMSLIFRLPLPLFLVYMLCVFVYRGLTYKPGKKENEENS